MAEFKVIQKRFNGSTWDTVYPKTTADNIAETTTYKILTSWERQRIADYLTSFDAANKLVKLDGDGLIPISLIPGGLDYLDTNNPTFTGVLTGPQAYISDGIYGSSAQETGVRLGSNTVFVKTGDTTRLTVNNSGINVNSQVLSGLITPTLTHHAANKAYVDSMVAIGVRWVAPVRVATTEPITTSGLLTIDGKTLVAGDRVLVKDQSTPAQNGVYTVASGAWAPVNDDSTQGATVFVEEGTTYNNYKFHRNATEWVEISAPETITASTGLEKVGDDIRVKAGGITDTMVSTGINITKSAGTAAQNLAWTETTIPTVSKSLQEHLTNLYTAIRRTRGETSYNINNTTNLKDVATLAEAKNRSYIGTTTTPTGGTYITGDTYFEDITP